MRWGLSPPHYRFEGKMERRLDRMFYRVVREGKALNMCFSDLTKEEMKEIVSKEPKEVLERMCILLGETLKEIGNELNIERIEEDD
jgi:hypothetical protein